MTIQFSIPFEFEDQPQESGLDNLKFIEAMDLIVVSSLLPTATALCKRRAVVSQFSKGAVYYFDRCNLAQIARDNSIDYIEFTSRLRTLLKIGFLRKSGTYYSLDCSFPVFDGIYAEVANPIGAKSALTKADWVQLAYLKCKQHNLKLKVKP